MKKNHIYWNKDFIPNCKNIFHGPSQLLDRHTYPLHQVSWGPSAERVNRPKLPLQTCWLGGGRLPGNQGSQPHTEGTEATVHLGINSSTSTYSPEVFHAGFSQQIPSWVINRNNRLCWAFLEFRKIWQYNEIAQHSPLKLFMRILFSWITLIRYKLALGFVRNYLLMGCSSSEGREKAEACQ